MGWLPRTSELYLNPEVIKMNKWVIDIKVEDYDVYQRIEENLDNPHFMKMMADEDYFIEHALKYLEGVRPSFQTTKEK